MGNYSSWASVRCVWYLFLNVLKYGAFLMSSGISDHIFGPMYWSRVRSVTELVLTCSKFPCLAYLVAWWWLGFYPSAKKPKGYCNEHVRPSLREVFSFFAVQAAFLHLTSPFLVCRLQIKSFWGSFNDFEKFPYFGSKTANFVTENIHF